MEIASRIDGVRDIPWRELKWLQGDLKRLPPINLAKLKASLVRESFVMPFHVWQNGDTWILDGHQRQRAMIELEREGNKIPDLLPAVFVKCRDMKQARELVLVFASQHGEVTGRTLLDFIEQDESLTPAEMNDILRIPGINMKDFLKENFATDIEEPPEVAVSEEVITKPGDRYELGKHVLLCGDSTDPKMLKRLMASDEASMVFTDPPYGVTYQAERFTEIEGDNLRNEQLYGFLVKCFRNLVKFTKDTAAFYIWHASTTRREFEDAMRDTGIAEKQYIIWIKDSFVLGHADYHWQHEPCFYAEKYGSKAKFYATRKETTAWQIQSAPAAGRLAVSLSNGLRITTPEGESLQLAPASGNSRKVRSYRLNQGQSLSVARDPESSDVWQVKRDASADYGHPTQKPVRLAARAIQNSSEEGEIVLDIFGGSGCTLLAAEQTARSARVLELEAKYVDVIIRRWLKFTKSKTFTRNGSRCHREEFLQETA